MAFLVSAGLCGAQPVSIDVAGEPPATMRSSSTPNESPYGRRIVEVRYKPASLKPTDLSLGPGQTLTTANLSAALNQLASHLTRHSEMIAAAAGTSALIFTYVDADFDLHPNASTANDAVAVTLRPFHLSLPLDEIGGRVLPIPRGLSAKAASIDARSPFLPANLAFSNDRVLGTSVGGRWQFEFGPNDTHQAVRAVPHIQVRAGGLKSLDSAFYSGDAALRIAHTQHSGLLRQLFGAVEFSSSLEPRGSARYSSSAWGGSVGNTLSLNANSRVVLDARYAKARHKFSEARSAPRWVTTDEQGNRVVFETIPRGVLGFLRAAVWQENLHDGAAGTSQRLVGRAGYAKEIPVGVNQSVGMEIIAGAGRTWGNVDAGHRFFAGGNQGEFLFENASARTLTLLPDGPLLRSLGKAQGGFRQAVTSVRGGTRFWHANLNISLPIPKWSRPLIPNETTDLPGADGSPQTLKQILRAQVDRTGPNMLQSTLQASDGLTPDEAKRRANEIFDEIRPATHFVIDQANVFAVKPLLMFDAAELESAPGRASWLAAGAGVQLTVVTAKFEAGYMRTLSGPTFGSRGNVFARLGFERLF